jgi:hypothetical protein
VLNPHQRIDLSFNIYSIACVNVVVLCWIVYVVFHLYLYSIILHYIFIVGQCDAII